MSEEYINSQTKLADAVRSYRPSPWVVALGNARSTWLNFDYIWDHTVGQRIYEKDAAQKNPPISLLSFSRMEVDVFIKYREGLKAAGLASGVNSIKANPEAHLTVLETARLAHPQYNDILNRMHHHVWHTWGLPPAAGLSMVAKYIFIGGVWGITAACAWRYGYHLPYRRNIDAYYKTLYAEHPEYWPALSVGGQKK